MNFTSFKQVRCFMYLNISSWMFVVLLFRWALLSSSVFLKTHWRHNSCCNNTYYYTQYIFFPRFILVSKYVGGRSIFLVLMNGFVYIWVFIASCLQRIFLFLCSQLKTSPINLLYLYLNLLFLSLIVFFAHIYLFVFTMNLLSEFYFL